MTPWNLLKTEDIDQAVTILGGRLRPPDLVIAPDGEPYLYRWYVLPRRKVKANIYLHLQVGSDPERPLHDHPWDNTSVILAGGYMELLTDMPGKLPARRYMRREGDVVYRKATTAHRLFLPSWNRYTMTLFTTGPVVRQWGYWTDEGWVDEHDLTKTLADGTSVFTGKLDE